MKASVGTATEGRTTLLDVPSSPTAAEWLNIEGNDYRLIAVVQYTHGVLMIRFFGSREDYDKIDAETV